jgi:3-hydroxyisobutyrate dehydrogenase-like beta-hydroxyacid dehydrogenase
LAIKDTTHALDLAEQCGAAMPSTRLAKQHLEDVKDHDGSKGDIAGIYGAVRESSGLPFENGS